MESHLKSREKSEVDWHWLQTEIFIRDNGKIRLPHISIDIVKGCNMSCEHCSHLSPLMHGHYPKEDLLSSLAAWSKKLQPKRFAILGGEPLLHPYFEEIVLSAHLHWNESEIVVVSNGTLLEKLNDSFLWDCGKLGRIRFDISQHIESPEWVKKFELAQKCFSVYGVPITLRQAYSKWMVIYQQSDDSRYIPHHSSPQKSWDVCAGRSFYKIHDGNLWYCTRLSSIHLAAQEGLFGEEWNRILQHQPMRLENTQEEILTYLKQAALPECSMCPEMVEVIDARQMPLL
ncbi:MAG: radical SAM protein [Planctomycetaceae bacterium]|jgi:organic radical activating enzyme|nr:radical SAM protein [Planctomycetaceae bacterium]